MGGIKVSTKSEVMTEKEAIPGLWAAGEVMGGTHGKNRLGGNSLLDCVVFGRIAGQESVKYHYNLLTKIDKTGESSPLHQLETIKIQVTEPEKDKAISGPTE